MSFSGEQKKDVISAELKSQCCKSATLYGMLAARATVDNGCVQLSLSSDDVLRFASEIYTEIYSKSSEITTSQKGGRRKLLTLKSHALEKYVQSLEDGITVNERCPGCKAAFIRGVFLASGRITDPQKQYLLEFSLGKRAEKFTELFSELGLTPRLWEIRSEKVIYFKSSSEIEDFFALSGMNSAAFAIMNEKIQSEIRNSANRIANCETNNIVKAVSASMNQIALIRKLSEKGLLSLLPEELESTARARMEHSELSLAQLASIMTPPISKPGLSHRLKKITAIAEELLKKSEK